MAEKKSFEVLCININSIFHAVSILQNLFRMWLYDTCTPHPFCLSGNTSSGRDYLGRHKERRKVNVVTL